MAWRLLDDGTWEPIPDSEPNPPANDTEPSDAATRREVAQQGLANAGRLRELARYRLRLARLIH